MTTNETSSLWFPKLIMQRSLTIVFCLLAVTGAAQAQSATDGSTPAGYTAGAPAGSYSLSGFDNINFGSSGGEQLVSLCRI
ncbi:MAG: hypothetical protein ACR2H6_06825 [Pyrinomonadaceae bacterium]